MVESTRSKIAAHRSITWHKAGVDERLGDERSGDISREARDLRDFAIGKRALSALGSLHDESPSSGCREAGLPAAVGSPQASVDREQDLPCLDFVRHRVGKGAMGHRDRVDLG